MGKIEPLVLEPVAPVGTEKVRVLGDGQDANGKRWGGVIEIPVPRFPAESVEAGKKLREIRRELELTVPEAADLFGLRVLQVRYLEQGHFKCDYAEAERRLRGVKW